MIKFTKNKTCDYPKNIKNTLQNRGIIKRGVKYSPRSFLFLLRVYEESFDGGE